MAKNISWLGNVYTNVPAITLPQQGGGTALFTELSPTTATAGDVTSGKVFFTADGTQTNGTGSGGSSSWVLLHQEDITTSTTSTTASSIKSITGVTGAWDETKIIYVRIRDKAGPRAGYFYGSDSFFINWQKANGSTTAPTTAGRLIHRYSTSSQWGQYVGATTTAYGVYGYDINSSGRVRIYQRYNSNYSLTINGTYRVQIYSLAFPDGKSPYNTGAITGTI